MRALTVKQSLVLKHIVNHIKREGFPPTIREIQTAMGYGSNNSPRHHLAALERKKYIKTANHIARGIKVLRSV